MTADQVIDWLLAERNAFWARIEVSHDRMHQARSVLADRTFCELTFPARPLSWRLTREELFAAVHKQIVDAAKEKLLR